MSRISRAVLVGTIFATAARLASADIAITEVDPYGSNGSDGYSADWFELTNTGSAPVSIVGWSMVDDNAASNSAAPYASGNTISIGNLSSSKDKTFGAALLTLAGGGTTIGAHQSVIFLESSSAASASGTLISSFESAWFGTAVPAGVLVGTYDDGSNALYGLSQTADMVNIFNGSTKTSALVASVAFGADTGTPVATFDNAAGLNDTTLTTKSAVGIDGAFVSASSLEVGSPSVVPLPGTSTLLLSALGILGILLAGRRRGLAQVTPREASFG